MEHLLTCVCGLPRVNGVVGLRLIEMLTLQFINSTSASSFMNRQEKSEIFDLIKITIDNVPRDPLNALNRFCTTLRNILGTKTLQEVLQDKESIAHHMQVNKKNSIFILSFNKL